MQLGEPCDRILANGGKWESLGELCFSMLSLPLLFASSCLESRHHTWQFSNHLVTMRQEAKGERMVKERPKSVDSWWHGGSLECPAPDFYSAYHCSLGFLWFAAKCIPDTSISNEEMEKGEEDNAVTKKEQRWKRKGTQDNSYADDCGLKKTQLNSFPQKTQKSWLKEETQH